MAQRAADTTRARLLRAAEQLFAEKGIDAVSLREINRVAGARNAIAVQYWFEDRDGLLRAVVEKHRPAVEGRRHAVLDELEAEGDGDLRGLAAALVRPSASKLADPDGGRHYLRIHAELVNRPRPMFEALAGASDADGEALGGRPDSITRWRRLAAPLLDDEATRLHRRFTAIRFAAAELGRRAASGPHTDERLFVSHLIDLVAAVLAAPVSAETVRLADERDRARTGTDGDAST